MLEPLGSISIGAILGFLGRELVAFLSKRSQKKYETTLARVEQIKTLQLPAYRELWERTKKYKSWGCEEFDDATMKADALEIREWYYAKGNGIHLSFQAQRLLQAALRLLDDGPWSRGKTPKDLGIPDRLEGARVLFSHLRTQLKEDLNFYSDQQAAHRLGTETTLNRYGTEIAEEFERKAARRAEWRAAHPPTGAVTGRAAAPPAA